MSVFTLLFTIFPISQNRTNLTNTIIRCKINPQFQPQDFCTIIRWKECKFHRLTPQNLGTSAIGKCDLDRCLMSLKWPCIPALYYTTSHHHHLTIYKCPNCIYLYGHLCMVKRLPRAKGKKNVPAYIHLYRICIFTRLSQYKDVIHQYTTHNNERL